MKDNPLQLIAYDQSSLFDELKPEWNDLLQRSSSNRIFSTWEWNATWWQAFEPGALWVIACRDDSGKLVGLAPWFIEQHPEKGRVVCTIGCREVTDYLDIIADRDYTGPVLGALAAYLVQYRASYDQIELCNIPEDSISYQNFPACLRQHGFEVTLTHEDVCPIIQLPATWDEYLNSLDKKNRHEIRRKMRRAEGEGGDTQWYIVGQSDNIDEKIEEFLKMMAASDPAKTVFLSDLKNVTFFKRIASVLHARGWLQLAFLTVDNRDAAAYLNFDYDGKILVYNSGLYPEEYGHLSPGIVLLANIIQHAIDTGHTVFDFLQGDEIYKYRMGGQDTHVHDLVAKRS
jgi:CelD/BcsL family acetyltransferase involved in cellulose biosynthesis